MKNSKWNVYLESFSNSEPELYAICGDDDVSFYEGQGYRVEPI